MRRIAGAAPSLLAALGILLGIPLGGCATDPATGSAIFTGGMTPEREARLGRASHAKFVAAFGGEYGPPELRRYVDSIGQFLASTSELPDLRFTVTVLNSPDVNAFAVPGGYLYVTRGLLALADDEAELAAVLAHEIGHITARHGARQHGQGLLAAIGAAAAHIAGGGRYDDLVRRGATGVIRAFSREHEHEADTLAIRYLARAGYDPGAMARFLGKLRSHARLEARIRGLPPDSVDRFSYLATHPAPAERVREAAREARGVRVRRPIVGRDVYLSRIAGLVHGGDREQGFVRGRDFLHPSLRFAFRVPPGFSMVNSARAVLAFGPAGERVVFDIDPERWPGPLGAYIGARWMPSARLGRVAERRVNGVEAAVATTLLRAGGGEYAAHLAAYRPDPGTVQRLLFLAPRGRAGAGAAAARATVESVRRLTEAEARRLEPHRLTIVTVREGDTVAGLARRQPWTDHAVERFRVLNGLDAASRLRPGMKVKLVDGPAAR